MRKYEAMVIVDARLEEGDIQKAVEKFSSSIGEHGGTIANVNGLAVARDSWRVSHGDSGRRVALAVLSRGTSLAVGIGIPGDAKRSALFSNERFGLGAIARQHRIGRTFRKRTVRFEVQRQ